MPDSGSPRRPERPIPVGIDLGTTYSLLAYLDAGGRPISVPSSGGDLLTPSAVIVDEDAVVVGKEAVKASSFAPENYAECFKREMGRSAAAATVNGHRVPPEVLSGFVLERLKRDAQKRLGPLSQAVITVPAYFDELRRKATQDAGRLAGWKVLDIINEPTAAALACGWERGLFGLHGTAEPEAPERVVVYDLGGGTFDVSVLEIDGRIFRTLATDGDVRLGGKDFDECLVDHLAERFLADHGLDPRGDPQDAAQLWRDAQDLKHALSEHTKAVVACFHAGIRMRIEVTRAQFQALTAHLLQRTEETTSLVIQQAGLEWSEVDRVLVVGGASRMPSVGAMLHRLTGKEPDRSMSADEAVAHGAAIYAGMLLGRAGTDPRRTCQLINVNSHSLGVVGIVEDLGHKVNAVIIPRNTPIPAEVSKSFTTLEEDQRSVVVPVVEGESERPEFCVSLGQCVVRNLPPGLAKGTPVEVTYRYGQDGRLSVSARVPGVGQSAEVEIERRHTLSDDLAGWQRRLLKPRPPEANARVVESPEEGGDLAVGNRSATIRRLDTLYTKIGQMAIRAKLPAKYEPARDAARDAAEELKRARAALAELERRRQDALGTSQAVRIGIEVAKARMAERRAATNSRFAYLVLGRELATAGLCPVGAEPDLEEARSLRRQLV